jgi:hypothetical protein
VKVVSAVFVCAETPQSLPRKQEKRAASVEPTDRCNTQSLGISLRYIPGSLEFCTPTLADLIYASSTTFHPRASARAKTGSFKSP